MPEVSGGSGVYRRGRTRPGSPGTRRVRPLEDHFATRSFNPLPALKVG